MAHILDVTPDQYLSDPLEVPSLSSSIAHTLVSKSPAHAYVQHPRLGNAPSESTKSLDTGSLIHELVLGKGQGIVQIEADDFRTKAAREARDEATAQGKVPVLTHTYEDLVAVAGILRRKLWDDFGIALIGESEVCIAFEEVGEEGPVACRTMIDHLFREDGAQIELKTIRSADTRTIERHCMFYGYEIGCMARVSALTKLEPEILGRDQFLFAFCEVEPPYAVQVLAPSPAFRDLGERRWMRAVELWDQCLRTGKWPAYSDSIGILEPPAWALMQEEGEHDL